MYGRDTVWPTYAEALQDWTQAVLMLNAWERELVELETAYEIARFTLEETEREMGERDD